MAHPVSEAVGQVAEIMRYPVKSMAGERRAVAAIDWQGIEGDRQYAFVRRGNATRFPWFTDRDLSALVLHRARYDDPDRPRTSAVTVHSPQGVAQPLANVELHQELGEASGIALNLIQLGSGAHDLMPLSVVTTASLAKLEERHGAMLDRRRFRTNIVVDSDAFDLAWQGRRVRFGDGPDAAELLFAYPAPRCAMITIDPDTGTRDPRVLRTVVQGFGGSFTMYASVAQPGVVREGDGVHVLGG